LHEAVFTVKEDDMPENTIAVVMQTGFKIGDRVLRAAKCGIVKK
jgi:molecular chaperone GrpE (heat shock protein)